MRGGERKNEHVCKKLWVKRNILYVRIEERVKIWKIVSILFSIQKQSFNFFF